ncbi:D-alanine--D-alanine ligase [Paraglaciecola sp.]|uniref:D-alanine--D-alanine ligase n=1 Tax=Paraglaciecola sp. TaxID=1920173 RepID=UPI003EF18ED3
MNIEIITTLSSTLKETGFGLHSSCLDVLGSIKRTGNNARLTVCESTKDLHAIVARKPDLVFLAAKYLPIKNGDNIWFSDFFAKQKITFSGSDRKTLKYDSDKVLAKVHLKNMGINTAHHFTAIPKQYSCQDELPLNFPLFVKPIDAANGNGIDDLSFVNTFAEFEAKVLSIYALYNQPALIEEYLGGREFTVAIICNSVGEMTTSSIEVSPPESSKGLRILGKDVKLNDTECLKKVENAEDSHHINKLAQAAFLGLGVRGFGRIDIKMNNKGQCFFMEANLVPGMTLGSSYFPKACELASNLQYDDVISLMLEECSGRVISERALKQQGKHWPRALVAEV